MKLTFKVSCLELIEDIISLSMHRGLIDDLGLEAAEVCYRGRAFRNGMIYSRAVDVVYWKLIAEGTDWTGQGEDFE